MATASGFDVMLLTLRNQLSLQIVWEDHKSDNRLAAQLAEKCCKSSGGREEIRTPDPLLAKQVLSQLSYTPTHMPQLILRHFWSFQN